MLLAEAGPTRPNSSKVDALLNVSFRLGLSSDSISVVRLTSSKRISA
jgi:hypothetical protein